MTCTPLALAQLPRVPGASLQAVRRAMVRLGESWNRRISLTAPPFGTVSIGCLAVTSPEPPDFTDLVWMLAHAGRHGYVTVDGLGALRIMSGMLGLPAPHTFRLLGAGERGVVAAAVASLLRTGARHLMMSIGAGRWSADGLVRVELDVQSNMFHERAWLDVPLHWIPEGASDFCGRARACELEIPLAIELARTTLTARDWARVESGDAVVFDEPLPGPQDAWPVRFTCGTFSAKATFDPQGTIHLSAGFRDRAAVAVPDGDWEQTTTTGREIMGSTDRDASPATVLASAPIEVVAEVGRVVLRADELLALRSGSVLSLGPLRPTTVDLRIGDRLWAQGELVNVDGQLGVRVTALAVTGTASIKDQFEAETVRTSRGDRVG